MDDVTVAEVTQLTLEVNTTTGVVNLQNNSGVPIDIDFYQVTSDLASLSSTNWDSLEDMDYEGGGLPGNGAGWEELGKPDTPSETLLAEAYLQGSSELADANLHQSWQCLQYFCRCPRPGILVQVGG